MKTTVKLFEVLPEGAGSALAKAAKAQRAQEAKALAQKVKREAAERAEAYERSMLAAIDEYANVNPGKCLTLTDLYLKRYPKSIVKMLVEAVAERQRDIIAEKAARAEVKRLSRQGVPFVTSLPASWGQK